MEKRKISKLVMATMLSIGLLAGCGSNGSSESSVSASKDATDNSKAEIVLRYGDVNPAGHVLLDSAEYFAEQVSEMSDGRIKVKIYPSGRLGDDGEVYQAMQMGAVDLYRGNAASLTDFGDLEISALALPYIFRDRDHFWATTQSEVGQGILDNIQDSGSRIKGLFYMDEGARNFFTTDKPIHKLEDIKDMKIRVQNAALMLDTIAALGANATPIDYAELYTSLQTGIVDGAENPPASYLSNKFYEVAPYYVLDGHTYAPSVVLVSEVTWNNLSEADQQILVEAGELTEAYNREAIEAAERNAYVKLEAAGVEITELEDPGKWEAAMDGVYEKYGADYKEVIDAVKAIPDIQ